MSARNMDRPIPYSLEEEKRIVELWNDGNSASLVASKLNAEFLNGRSRNAIIGKAKRLGCVSRPSPIQVGRAMGGSNRYRRRKKRKAAEAILALEKAAEKALEDTAPADDETGTVLGIAAPRTSKQCQFIFGDVPRYPAEPMWCTANSEPGWAYCEKHQNLTHTAIPKRKPAGSRNVFNDSPLRRKYSP